MLLELKGLIEQGQAEGVAQATAVDAMTEVEEIATNAKEPEAEGAMGRIGKALRNLRRMAADFSALPTIAHQFGRLVDELGKIWS